MQPVRVLGVYLATVFLGGALVAPWLYEAVQALWQKHGALEWLAQQPFHRYVNRSMLLLALAGMWPFLKRLGAGSWEDVGLRPTRGWGRQMAAGVAVGFVSLACVAVAIWAGGARELKANYTAGVWLSKVGGAAASGVVVGWLEELMFRGALFGALRRAHSWKVALAWSSAFYALLHFFQRPASPAHVEWYSGLVTLGAMLRGFIEWQSLVPGFLSLTVAGMILGLCYHRLGRLYFSIGLHGGWVFWLKFFGTVTVGHREAKQWWWGSGKMYDGWLAFFVLSLVLVGCMRWFRHRSDESATSDGKEGLEKLA